MGVSLIFREKAKGLHAFVLLELVIVLVIVGLVYTLMIANFSTDRYVSDQGHFSLREWLKEYKSSLESTVTLVCLERTKRCFIEEDRQVIAEDVDLPEEITDLYYFDAQGAEYDYPEFYGIRYEKLYQDDVKFIFSYRPNHSSTACIAEINKKYYTYFAYFQDVREFDDFEDARRYLTHEDIKQNLVLAQ